MKKWMVNVLAVVAVVAAASSAWATPLVPGTPNDFISPVPATSGSAPWGPVSLVTSMTSSYSSPTLSGTVTTLVYKEAGGTLDFFYQVTSTNANPAIHLSVPGFGNTTTNAYMVTDPTILPSPASSNLGSVGYTDIYRIDPNVVGADFMGGLANASSYWLVVQTNATSYGSSTAFIQDGSQASAASLAPAPLPSSLALFATGAFGLVGGLIRRIRRTPM